jgi:capsular exopolysaccharide synthesis family protein
MSRIDEALRRAAAGGNVVAENDPRPTYIDPSTLARFPVETKTDGERAHRSDPPASTIPAPRIAPKQLAPVDAPRRKLLVADESSLAVEQYERIAATLHSRQMENGTKTVMIASALPRDGKSLTIANVALTLSESYSRQVLLIDTDLRRPSLHALFGVPANTRGLSEALRVNSSEPSFVELSSRLRLLPAGRADGSLLAGLTSERMQRLLTEYAAAFDWVLLDSPPVGLMPDANLVARLTDGVVFVIGAGSTPFPLVQRAIAELGPENIIGTVLNRVDPASIPATGYYQDYYGSAI